MYRLDWIERIRATRTAPAEGARLVGTIHPTVWQLGWTSLLTDISAEMVSSLLPVYLVLHLHMSPLQYGTIDGIYNGTAVAILSLVGGYIADKTRRHKEVAMFGYALSALCKPLLLVSGLTWGWLASIMAVDRVGKGARTAPRDALISLCTPTQSLAGAFAVHRAMDAGGALLGPVIAFLILRRMPSAFDAVWVTSFAFAVLGLGVLGLFVQNPTGRMQHPGGLMSWRAFSAELIHGPFGRLAMAGSLLGAMTISDGFLYLLLRERGGLTTGFFPLLYVVTACFYMLLSIPVGQIADRHGRARVFLAGYVAVGLLYIYLILFPAVGFGGCLVSLFLLGLYYAATEGVLVAMASSVLPAEQRTSGLAILATFMGMAKLLSSVFCGWLWQRFGSQTAVEVIALGLLAAFSFSTFAIRNFRHAKS